MFLLKKIFQLRDKTSGEDEKPFLEHLEDLRVMVTRVLITVIISTLACFSYQDELMDVLRRPMDQVAKLHEEKLLSELKLEEHGIQLTRETWAKAKHHGNILKSLNEKEKQAYLSVLPQDVDQEYVKIASLLPAIHSLDEPLRVRFIKELGLSDQLQKKCLLLNQAGNSLFDDQSKNLKMMSSLQPAEAFMLSIKLAFFAGLIISFPFLLYFILQFILPGLKDNERKALYPAMAIGFGLFLTGVCFAYFFVLPKILTFFFEYGEQLNISNDWRIGYYLSFATQFTLLFGLSFELPVVVMTLVKLGILTYPLMQRSRSYATVAIFVSAAILTPTPDIATMLFMAGPMVVLYEICIWLAYFDHKKALKKEADEELEYQAYLDRKAKREAENPGQGDDENDPNPRPNPTNPPLEPKTPNIMRVAYPDPTDPSVRLEGLPDDKEDLELMDYRENDEGGADWDGHTSETFISPEDQWRAPIEFEDPTYFPESTIPEEELKREQGWPQWGSDEEEKPEQASDKDKSQKTPNEKENGAG